VLLVHGTFTTPEESWDPGYFKVLPELGTPACTIDLPGRALEDAQASAEYVVYAIREMARRAGRRVSVIGHSQGALHPLWAMRFWPDVGAKVSDSIGLAGPFQGTQAANTSCGGGSCFEAAWQMRPGSAFLTALFAAPLPETVEYTSIATQFDQLVIPQPQASTLRGKPPILVQDVCPGRPVEHTFVLYEAVTFALVLDALGHAGPADPARVDPLVCAERTMPGADNPAALATAPEFAAAFAQGSTVGPQVDREPPLRCYVTNTCTAGTGCATRTGSGTTGSSPTSAARRRSQGELRLVRRCIGRGRLRVALRGDASAVRAVRFSLGGRDRTRPFRRTVARRTLARTRARRLRAAVTLRSGARPVVLSRLLPRCGLKPPASRASVSGT
jgi:triacylglycerol lipase